MIKRFIAYYKPHKKLFVLDMCCAFIVAVCDLFYPIITRQVINVYVPQQNLRLLLIWAVVLLLIYLVKAGLTYVVQYWGHIVGVRMQGDMRRDMFRHLQKLPFSFYDENKTGGIMSRMINDLQDVSELAHHGPEDLFLSIILLIGSFVMLATINLSLTLIAFAGIPFVIWFAVVSRKGMRDAFRKNRVRTADINAGVETAIAGMRVSRAYSGEEHENAKFDHANALFKLSKAAAYKAMGWFFSGTGFLTDMLYLVVLLFGGLFFFRGAIDAGDFAAFILYINMFLKPINKFITMFEQLQNGMTGFSRFVEVMDEPPEAEAPAAEDAGRLAGHIRFEGISFRYRNSDALEQESRVVSDLFLDIPAGRTLALVGPSGGGKTTLCNLIPRFYDVDAGAITIDGKDIRSLTRASLRRNIGIVAQDVFLFNGSIRENIAYGDLDATEEQIVEAAKKANIHEHIMTLEDGYDTNVGERGLKLSGGQRQRISIARVFLKNPAILILDEATSALDNETEMLIQKSLFELSRGRTCIIVAHRLSTIKQADEIAVLTRGGITERGTHAQLMALGGTYAALYNYQFRAEDQA
ncbi:MAG: ABC transporter ATP-binding protein [Clostridia bacterium]|nr:ABC transporter ATP-binding protein [Clostridia bacterium]